MEERITTLHPAQKSGVRISKRKYQLIKAEILKSLTEGPMTFTGLKNSIIDRLETSFEGSIAWYVVTVKLDLEARGDIVRVKSDRKELVRLKGE